MTRETMLNAIISGTLRDDYENHGEDQQEGTEITALLVSALVPKGREDQQEETEMTRKGYNNLKTVLQTNELSLKAFADFLGIGTEAAADKLNGKTDFTYPEYRRVCNFLFPEMNPDYLFAQTDMIEATAQIMEVLSDAYAEKVMLYASSLQTIQEEREDAEGGKQ